ncbi:DUF6183 family protein [Streptomyces sp. NPDC059819]|uniref:DUF6183 family protein n=1 Tax=Streptomyces sp. NPDC059819 TaxID=3346963 RepID=UPI003667E7DD
MAEKIEKIVAKLSRMKDVSKVAALAERRLAEGDATFVADLGIALNGKYGAEGDSLWQYRSLFGTLLRLLTVTPGQENIEQGLRLAATTESSKRSQNRHVASLLASSHPPQDLTVVFAGGSSHARASEELRACLVHELVLRGVDVAEMPGIAGWATSPHWSHHPLGWLPLSLSAFEEEPGLPSYHARGASWSVPYGRSDDGPQTAPDETAHVPLAAETTTDTVAGTLAAAVSNWAEESNGRIEARTFDLVEPVRAAAVPSMLASLKLESLRGLKASDRAAVSSCPAAHAWRLVFAAASTGGAYNHGLRGAYGRLASWRSLAGLSGATAHASAAEVEQQVLECDWYSFGAATKWFERVAWDIGLAAIAPGRRQVAVLAATDTD